MTSRLRKQNDSRCCKVKLINGTEKKYVVRLTEEERTDLEVMIHKGNMAAHKRLRAEILLRADISELGVNGS